MSKTKPKSTQAYMERLQAQIAKDIEGKDFKTIEEINAYIQGKYVGVDVKFEKKNLTPKEKAMDLVYEAMDSDNKKKIITLAEKALKLDEDCADAYNLLAEHKAKTPESVRPLVSFQYRRNAP